MHIVTTSFYCRGMREINGTMSDKVNQHEQYHHSQYSTSNRIAYRKQRINAEKRRVHAEKKLVDGEATKDNEEQAAVCLRVLLVIQYGYPCTSASYIS